MPIDWWGPLITVLSTYNTDKTFDVLISNLFQRNSWRMRSAKKYQQFTKQVIFHLIMSYDTLYMFVWWIYIKCYYFFAAFCLFGFCVLMKTKRNECKIKQDLQQREQEKDESIFVNK